MRAGNLATALGDYAGAIQNLRQAQSCFDETRSALHIDFCRIYLGVAYRLQGNYRQAEQTSRAALATFQAMNNPIHEGFCLLNLGCLALEQGDLHQAEQLQREALERWQQAGVEAWVADAARCLGHLMVATGEQRHAEARQHFRQALELATKHQMAPVALDVCVGVARLLAYDSNLMQAVELLALSEPHEASTFETREKARQLLVTLLAQAPPEAEQVARSPGRQWDLWGAVQELLTTIL